MEEAKDIRELKSLLSDLSLQDETRPSPPGREEGSGDTGARKIALLKSASVFLFSLSLFLTICLIFMLLRTYLVGTSLPENTQPQAASGKAVEVPPSITPAPVIAEHLAASPPDEPAVPAVPDLSGKPPVRSAVLREQGGSLYFIALKSYGRADETLFDLMLQANPAITDVRRIDDLHTIILPDITAESYVHKNAEGMYRVHIGTFDTADWARVYASRVKRKDKHIVIEPFAASSRDTWYRLIMGDFAHKQEAEETVASLARRGLIYIPPRLQ